MSALVEALRFVDRAAAPAKAGARGLLARLPRPLRRSADLAGLLWAAGSFARPRELVARARHRAMYARVQRAFFYHRFAAALLLGGDLGLFEALRARPLDAGALAAACGAQPNGVDALARILESEGVLVREPGGWALSEFAREYLVEGSPLSISSMLGLFSAHAAAFAELPACIASGASPKALDIFSETSRYVAMLEAVNAYLEWAAHDLLRNIDLSGVRSFVVGSMGVSFSAALLRKVAGARVTYGCLPHLAREIPRLRQRYAVDEARVDGTHGHSGDPDRDRWGSESFDLVLLTRKMMLAPRERLGERFAAKALRVLRPGGVAVLWETVHPDGAPTPIARAMSAVLDLGVSPDCPVLTERSLADTLRRIGFASVEVVPCLGGETTFVLARKAGA